MATQGVIATFYSYKGGTGRTMALANFAWMMAANGKKVLTIDWDLEAPGLHRYFRPFLVDPDLFETDGLIDTFWAVAASALAKSGTTAKSNAVSGEEIAEALADATRRLDSKDFFPKPKQSGAALGLIDFIGAGRQGATYSERVNTFNWKRFYDLGGADILSEIKRHLRASYDWILIDSRTGVSDTSGICTIQMPGTVVAFFTLNRQSIDGVTAILQSIRSFRSASTDGSQIKFFPIATRIENAEQARLEIGRRYARSALSDFLPDKAKSHPRAYWDRMEISYRPSYAFEEVLAAFGDATDAAGASDTMLSQVEATAQEITGDNALRMPEIGETERQEILKKYYFSSQPRDTNIAQATYGDDDRDFLRQIRSKQQLWQAANFDWRLLLSRSELDQITSEDLKTFGRAMSFYHIQSERMHKLLRRGQVAGTAIFVLTLLALIGLTGVSRGFSVIRYDPVVFGLSLFNYILMSWAASIVARILVAGVLDKPHGLRISQIVRIGLYGPFGPRIPEYQFAPT